MALHCCSASRAQGKPKQSVSNEAGSLIILAIFLIVASLACAALVIDSANVYRERTILQAAADAAALAGVAYTTERTKDELTAEAGGSSESNIELLLRQKSLSVLRAHLGLANINPASIPDSSITTEYLPQPTGDVLFDYRVGIQAAVPTLLLQNVPFEFLGMGKAADRTILNVKAASRRKIANVAVLFDISSSMGCPADETGQDCSCKSRSRDPAAAGCATPTKLDKAIDAAKTFSRYFDFKRDEMLLVPFNMKAEVYWIREQMQKNGVTEVSDALIDQAITWGKLRYAPSSSSNLCDALIEAFQKYQTIAPNKPVSYLIFSDGAATAGRFFLANPKTPNLPKWTKFPGAQYDYVHYSVTWSAADKDHVGPSPLVQTGMLGVSHPSISPAAKPAAERPDPTAQVAPCGPAEPPLVSDDTTFHAATTSVFKPCLHSLAAYSLDQSRIYGSQYSESNPEAFDRYAEQYYNCAIEYTDYIRRNKGTVHSIGYGPPATQTGNRSTDDPYQKVNDVSSRKDYALVRDANAFLQGVSLPLQNGEQAYPNFPGFDTMQDWDEGRNGLAPYGRQQGQFLGAPTDGQFKALFDQIARTIMLSLIE